MKKIEGKTFLLKHINSSKSVSLDGPAGGKLHVDRDHGHGPRAPQQILDGEKMMSLNPYSSRNIYN